MGKLLGSIEAGGTKFVCAVGNENLEIVDTAIFPTQAPEETMKNVIAYFKKFEIEAFGIASFGPIDIKKDSKTYGYITSTPKEGWRNFDFLGIIGREFDLPMFWTTDVNASAYGEYIADPSATSLVYYTIGTGIGGGAIQEGSFIGGVSHAEMGHTYVKRHVADKDFPGVCPYHGDCLEGMASGPSIEKRLGIKGEEIEEDNPVWDIISYYVAQAAIQATLILAPKKIVFGGGVTGQRHFMNRVGRDFLNLMKGYVEVADVETYLVNSVYSNNESATIGNFALALRELK